MEEPTGRGYGMPPTGVYRFYVLFGNFSADGYIAGTQAGRREKCIAAILRRGRDWQRLRQETRESRAGEGVGVFGRAGYRRRCARQGWSSAAP